MPGALAEWLGRGLQSLVQQFESARRLSHDAVRPARDALFDARRGGGCATAASPPTDGDAPVLKTARVRALAVAAAKWGAGLVLASLAIPAITTQWSDRQKEL